MIWCKASGSDAQSPFFFENCWYMNYSVTNGVFVKFDVTSGLYFDQCAWSLHADGQQIFQTGGAGVRTTVTNSILEIGADNDTTLLDITAGSSNKIYSVWTENRFVINGGGGGTAVVNLLDNDATSFAAGYNSGFIFKNNYETGGAHYEPGDTGTGMSDWRVIIEDNLGLRTTSNGSATILNGNNSVTVTHSLGYDGTGFTPTCIKVTGAHSEVAYLHVSAPGAATFVINNVDGADPPVAKNVTADRTVYWEAYYQA